MLRAMPAKIRACPAEIYVFSRMIGIVGNGKLQEKKIENDNINNAARTFIVPLKRMMS